MREETEVRSAVAAALEEIEREEKVRVLFAVESGSRAWGFASPDSDYDVRFVYARASVRDYARLSPPRDVVERSLPGDLDVSGWDLFKALRLFAASNPPLLEWLQSPITYRDDGDLRARLSALAATDASPRRMAFHYGSMARRNWQAYIAGREEGVRRKKYLYVLRPLLCVRWIAERGGPPPTALSDVLAGIPLPVEMRARLDDLLAEKRAGGEMGAGPADPILNAFILADLERAEALAAALPDVRMDLSALDRIAWEALGL